jgi:xanthine dehydrogenase small subunit
MTAVTSDLPAPASAPADSAQPIRFFHRGAVVEVSGVSPTRSVLDWLREDARCTGTKEGCNEGDCGACTVVIGDTAEPGDPLAVRGLRLTTANACLQFLPTLDGRALFTVEDLKAMNAGALHPVQQAMVECHGSQCGFCTPGFVMSLWATREQHGAAGTLPSRQQLADNLSGNLCRCTGYRPILDAGERMFTLPAAEFDTAPALAALQSLRRDRSFVYAGTAPPDRFFAPTTLDELAHLYEAKPDARLLAGSTDIGLWVNKQFRPLGDIVYVGRVAAMKRIEVTEGELRIGAGASLEAAWSALAARFKGLADVWLRFASKSVRHTGTMGGNLANGSPIGDSAPVLMALDASVELRRGGVVRRVPLDQFYLGYMRNQMAPGEFVQTIVVPLAAASRQVRAYKISKRFDCDISALCAGFSIEIEAGIVKAVRLAFGGLAATVKRAVATESAALGQPWTQATVNAAQAALAAEFAPLSDLRASAAYRLQVAQNLLQRLWLETRVDKPLSTDETTVFARAAHVTGPVAATEGLQ